MNKIQIMSRLTTRIQSCYEQLMSARANRYMDEIYVEGFRCRLDELILLYHLIRNISFCEACQELGITYSDVNVLDADEEESEVEE